jgi:hypothetical protein
MPHSGVLMPRWKLAGQVSINLDCVTDHVISRSQLDLTRIVLFREAHYCDGQSYRFNDTEYGDKPKHVSPINFAQNSHSFEGAKGRPT